MPVRHYCTLFDKNYMSRGLALGESLRTHSPGARWYVLCLDDEAFYYLTDLQHGNPRVQSLDADQRATAFDFTAYPRHAITFCALQRERVLLFCLVVVAARVRVLRAIDVITATLERARHACAQDSDAQVQPTPHFAPR